MVGQEETSGWYCQPALLKGFETLFHQEHTQDSVTLVYRSNSIIIIMMCHGHCSENPLLCSDAEFFLFRLAGFPNYVGRSLGLKRTFLFNPIAFASLVSNSKQSSSKCLLHRTELSVGSQVLLTWSAHFFPRLDPLGSEVYPCKWDYSLQLHTSKPSFTPATTTVYLSAEAKPHYCNRIIEATHATVLISTSSIGPTHNRKCCKNS